MKKLSLIISILGILIIIFLANNQTLEYAVIEEISTNEDFTKIKIQEQNQTLIIFEDIHNIKPGDEIKFYGKKEAYKGQEQIIIQKIILIEK